MAAILLSESNIKHSPQVLIEINSVLPEKSAILYIASAPDPEGKMFDKYVKDFFSSLGLNKSYYLGLEGDDWQNPDLEDLKRYDGVFLSGGNTYRFLYWLKHRNLGDLLDFYLKEKVLIGISAGAMVLMPRIDLASDEKNSKYSDSVGLNLIDFYLKPHFEGKEAQVEQLKLYKQKVGAEIYAVENDGMLIYQNEKVKTFGNVYFV